MPCFKPLRGFRGQRGLVIRGRKVSRLTPESELSIPCGQCTGCRIDRAKQWAIRCLHEASLHHSNYFATLTYETEPHGGTLVRHHYQNFMKRLRKARPGQSIRYYMCGEYGDNLSRPHYHACLFNIEFSDLELWKVQNGHRLYRSDELEKIWGHGYCLLGDVTFESAAYVARYVMKKIWGKDAQKTDENGLTYYERMDLNTGEIYQIEPEYNTMSLKPAIGHDWFKKYSLDCYPSDFITNKGSKQKLPRYYDKLFEKEDQEQYETVKKARRKRAEKHAENNTPRRLKVREKVLQAKLKQLKRPLDEQ